MPTIPKITADISFQSYTTIQHGLTGGGQFGDTAPSDGAGGAGPYLVFENGIWKYPEQASVGRINIPSGNTGPLRLLAVLADLGAASAWDLHIASTSNTSGTPYPSGDAAKYTEGDITVDSNSTRYIRKSYNIGQMEQSFLIFPGQRIYFTTASAATGARVRFTLARAFDNKS